MNEVTGSQHLEKEERLPTGHRGAVLVSTMAGHMLNKDDGRFQSELVPGAEKAGY